MPPSFPTKGLYAITPDISDTQLLLDKVKKVLVGGVALIQYRDKISNASEKIFRAKAIHRLCLQHSVPLIINDDPELALVCKAEGVHLGQTDGSIQHARALLGDSAIIGITCHHDISLAITAEQQGADYVAFGRFFNSSTKPGAPLATTDTLINAKKKIRIPIVAIGGVTVDNVKPIISAGANFIAVVDGLFSQQNILSMCEGFHNLF
ncbi:MAG: thiamine phosphate synthase [Cycloclasticus sp.]|nr:thiamine phosphate synthase [Cycloclasticus sp.]